MVVQRRDGPRRPRDDDDDATNATNDYATPTPLIV